VHTHCPQIINGTLTETETEEEKEDEFEEVRKDALEGGEPPISSRDFQNKFDRVERRRKNFRQNIKKEMKDENEEDVENEIEQPDQLERYVDPYNYNTKERHIQMAFCHDLTIRYKNYTEGLHHNYFFAPFKSTTTIMVFFIFFTIAIAGGCFYAFSHTDKSSQFFKDLFKTSKRPPTPDYDPDDVVDSDDEKPQTTNTTGTGNRRNPNLFSTPEHNPNNPFNQTNGSTPRRHR